MLKIAGIVLCEITVYILLKQYKPEFAILSEAASVIVVMLLLTDEIKNTVAVFSSYFGFSDTLGVYITLLIKVLAIALITQFTADLCRDSGESALAAKVEFSGKIIITAASMPVIEGFIGLISGMVEKV